MARLARRYVPGCNVLVLYVFDDASRSTPAIENLDVNLENAIESLSPSHRSVTLSRIWL
jgi:hypothetical protein